MEILFRVSALFAEIVGTMAGFGSSIIFLPIALFFYDSRTALILFVIFHISENIGRIAFFRHGFLPQEMLNFIPSFFLVAIAGSFIGKKIVNKIPKKSSEKSH